MLTVVSSAFLPSLIIIPASIQTLLQKKENIRIRVRDMFINTWFMCMHTKLVLCMCGIVVTATEPDGLNERDQRDAAVLIEEFGILLVRNLSPRFFRISFKCCTALHPACQR
jgi:hypothetical protein